MKNIRQEDKIATYAAFIAAGLFTIRFVIFFLPRSWQAGIADGTVPGFLLAVGEHIFMLPVIWKLPAPGWAKLAGALWILNDIITDTLALAGVSAPVYLTERYLGHFFFAASWLFAAG